MSARRTTLSMALSMGLGTVLAGALALAPAQAAQQAQASPASQAAAEQTAQVQEGFLSLVRLQPDDLMILVYVDDRGAIVPAQVADAEGNVVAAEALADAVIVWVDITDDGAIRPLQMDADGTLAPARVDDAGAPVLPEGALPAGREPFPAQVSADGRLLPILFSLKGGFAEVAFNDAGQLAEVVDTGPAAPAAEAPDPFSVTVSLDNNGSKETGQYVGNLGLSHTDLWGKGHQASLDLSTSTAGPEKSSSFFATYAIPLDGLITGQRDRVGVQANGYTSDFDQRDPGAPRDRTTRHRGYGLGGDYTLGLFSTEHDDGSHSDHGLKVGLLYDKSWSVLGGFGQDDQTSIVHIPLTIGYDFSRTDATLGYFSFGLAYVRNLPVGNAGNGDDYRFDRPGADPRWDKFTANASHAYDWDSGWSYNAQVFGQWTREPLIGAQAFSLGGLYSVRGLETSKVTGERGISGQAELLTPDLLSLWDGDGLPATVRALAFVDGGWLKAIRPTVGNPGTVSVVTLGLGLKVEGPYGTFANGAIGWLAGGSARGRYRDEDGGHEVYFSLGATF